MMYYGSSHQLDAIKCKLNLNNIQWILKFLFQIYAPLWLNDPKPLGVYWRLLLLLKMPIDCYYAWTPLLMRFRARFCLGKWTGICIVFVSLQWRIWPDRYFQRRKKCKESISWFSFFNESSNLIDDWQNLLYNEIKSVNEHERRSTMLIIRDFEPSLHSKHYMAFFTNLI